MASDGGFQVRHVRLVSSYWMRFSVRTGGGLMAIFLVLMSGLTVAHLFITPAEQIIKEAAALGHTEGEAVNDIERIATSPQVVGLIQDLTGQNEAEVEYLLTDQPALLSCLWLILLIIFPFVTAIGAFNQTAGDIGSKGLRYLLLRTERSNIYVGRSVGTVYFMAASLLLLMILVLLYVGLKLRLYDFGELMGSGLQAFLALVFLSLPYIALCGWLSSMFESPFASLSICLLLVGGPIVAFKMADSAATEMDLEWLLKLLPWGWKYDLLSVDMGTRLAAFGMMIAFTAVFFFLGMRSFARRDL